VKESENTEVISLLHEREQVNALLPV